jgi:hypothetical protein
LAYRKGTPHYYFLPSGADEYYGYFTLEDILKKLATLVVEHRIDPSTLSGP